MRDSDESLPKGSHFRTRSELIARLEHWLANSDDKTLGDTSTFGGTPWTSFDSSQGPVHLNADTRRSAIERMVRHARTHADAEWFVVANSRGRVNKVVFDREDSAEGWYAYLREPLTEPTSIS